MRASPKAGYISLVSVSPKVLHHGQRIHSSKYMGDFGSDREIQQQQHGLHHKESKQEMKTSCEILAHNFHFSGMLKVSTEIALQHCLN